MPLKPTLSAFQIKTLLQVVELNGGLDIFEDGPDKTSLSKLLDDYESTFGKKGDQRRRLAQTQIYRWRKFASEDSYKRLLLKYNIVARQDQSQSPTQLTSTRENPRSTREQPRLDLSESSESSTEEYCTTKTNRAKMYRKELVPRLPQTEDGLPPNTQVVSYNSDRPEGNGVAAVFAAKNINGNKNTIYEGFDIWVEADLRYLQETNQDMYKARIWNTYSILVTVPAWPYSLLNNREGLVGALRLTDFEGKDHIINSLDNALHYETENQEKFKHILIEFDDNVILSTKEISNDDSILYPQLFAEQYVGGFKHWIVYTVLREDIPPTKKGKVEDNLTVGVLRQQLGKLAFGTSGTSRIGSGDSVQSMQYTTMPTPSRQGPPRTVFPNNPQGRQTYSPYGQQQNPQVFSPSFVSPTFQRQPSPVFQPSPFQGQQHPPHGFQGQNAMASPAVEDKKPSAFLPTPVHNNTTDNFATPPQHASDAGSMHNTNASIRVDNNHTILYERLIALGPASSEVEQSFRQFLHENIEKGFFQQDEYNRFCDFVKDHRSAEKAVNSLLLQYANFIGIAKPTSGESSLTGDSNGHTPS